MMAFIGLRNNVIHGHISLASSIDLSPVTKPITMGNKTNTQINCQNSLLFFCHGQTKWVDIEYGRLPLLPNSIHQDDGVFIYFSLSKKFFSFFFFAFFRFFYFYCNKLLNRANFRM